jgi:hypothetical protein
MKTIRILAVLLAVALAGASAGPTSANAAAKTKVVAFKGSYSGTASLLIDNNTIKILSVTGTGTASIIGAGSLSGTGNSTAGADSNLCVPFKGKGSIKGSGGTIKFSVTTNKGKGCSSGQTGPVTVTVTGTAKVTSGSGGANGAKGNLKFKGTLKLNDTTGSQTGTFKGKVSGNLTVNK